MIGLFKRERTGKSISKENRREVHFNVNDPSLPQFAKLCRMVMEAGLTAFSTFLRNQHSSDQVLIWLAQPEVHKTLRRLRIREVISEEYWQQLYPNDKRQVDMDSFDLTLTLLLVKYATNLQKPFPNGWTGQLRDNDLSSGAIIVRFSQLRQQMSRLTGLNHQTYCNLLRDIKRYVTHFGGDVAKNKLHEIRRASVMSELDQHNCLTQFKSWHWREESTLEREENIVVSKERRSADIPMLQRRIVMRREKMSSQSASVVREVNRREKKSVARSYVPPSDAKNRWSDIQTGMVNEEKNIMEKYYDRLVADIKPDAIIDQLLARKVINMEESNDVFSILKSHDQMKILIDIVVARPGESFIEFLNSIKSRYSTLYNGMHEEYTKVIEKIKATKPEGVPYCKRLLIERYEDVMSAWRPLLWYPELEVKLDDFYCPLQLYDLKGKPIEPENILKPDKADTPLRLVVIEGDSGTGKSTLAKYLAHRWTENTAYFNGANDFQMVFYIDLKIPAGNLKIMMIEQLFGSNFLLTERELWEVIDDHQEMTLFILDGYEDNVTNDTLDILQGQIAHGATIILMSHTKFTPELQERFDRKIVLTGFAKRKAEDFVNKYVDLTRRPKELFQPFLEKLAPAKREPTFINPTQEIIPEHSVHCSRNHHHEEKVGVVTQKSEVSKQPREGLEKTKTFLEAPVLEPIDENEDGPNETTIAVRQRAGSVIAGSLMGFIKPSTMQQELKKKLSNGVGMKKETEKEDPNSSIFQEKLTILRYYSHVPLFCSFFCAMTDLKLSIDLSSWTAMIEQFLTAIKMKLIERGHESRFNVNKTYTQLADISIDTIKNDICTVFVRDYDNDCLIRFGVLQEAVPFANPGECDRYYFPNRIMQEYLAARSLDMGGFDEASRFFQGCNLTRQLHNIAVFYCGLRKNDFETMALRALFNKITEINRHTKPSTYINEESKTCTQGNVMDYQFSLDCVGFMSGKRDQTTAVVQTLPDRVRVDYKGLVPVTTLLGMSFAIEVDDPTLKEIDLRLDILSRQIPNVYMKLAQAIQSSQHVSTFRVIWEERELMSDIFASVCEDNKSVRTLEFFDESRYKVDKLSNKIWTNIRAGSSAMVNVKSFGFKNCRHFALVNAVIRNMPLTLHELDMSGCDINIIGSQDLATKIVKSKDLKKVILAGVRIESMAFNTFIKAFCTNRSVHELNLSQVKLDNVCFFALAEALKANNKLECLILTQVAVNMRSCEELTQVMKINNTLRDIHLTGSKIAPQGKSILMKSAKHVTLHGIIEKRKSSPEISFETDMIY